MPVAASGVGGRISTRVDELIKLISAQPQISSSDAAKKLNVGQEMIESWARFLEKAGDIKIVYRGLTPTYVVMNERHDEPEDDAPKAPKRRNTFKELQAAIQGQTSAIMEAVKQKSYDGIKPAVEAVRTQLERIKKRLEESSVEAKDREALSAALEKVSTRVDSIESGASAKSFFKLKSDARHLSREVTALGKQIPEEPPEPEPAPQEPERAQNVDGDSGASHSEGAEKQDGPERSFETRIEELEQQVREAVASGRVDRAESLNAELEQLYEQTLPQRYEQMRSHLKNQIYTIRKDIAFASDESAKRTFEEQHARLVDLIGRYEQAMQTQDWTGLEDLERSIVEIYNALPIGFEDQKKGLEERFGALIVEAAKRRRSALTEETERLHVSMDAIKKELEADIEKGDFTAAQQAYRQLKSLLDDVPAQLVIERIEMQSDLLSEFDRLTKAFKERFIARNESRIERCTHLIEAIKKALRDGDGSAASADYESALGELAHIDHNYFEQRSRLQYDLMRVHKDLLDLRSQDADSRFEQLASAFQQTLADGRNYIVHGEAQLAEQVYLKLLDLYRQLPTGREERKKAFKDQIFDYYKGLMTMDTSGSRQEVDIDDILERLVNIHHALNAGDPSALGSDLTRIEQLVEALPDEYRKRNPSLDRELIRLVHLRRIYDRILAASQALDRGERQPQLGAFIEQSEAWLEREAVSASSILMMLRVLKARIANTSSSDAKSNRNGASSPDARAPVRSDAASERARSEPSAKHRTNDEDRSAAGHSSPRTPAPDAQPEVPGSDSPLGDLASRIDTIKSLLKE